MDQVRLTQPTRGFLTWFLDTGKKYPALWTVGVVLAAMAVRVALQPLIGPIRAPFITAWVAVVLVAVVCGRWHGILSVVALAAFGWAAFLGDLDESSLVNVALFVVFGSVIVLLVAWLTGDREHHVLVAKEFKHRTRNLIQVFQAIIIKTVTDASEQQALIGRLDAIAHADYLAAETFEKAEISALIRDALAPFTDAKITIDVEPGYWAEARTAMYLRLLFHEWATNSTKHGALRPCQRARALVVISLKTNGTHMVLAWIESMVTNLKPMTNHGFGTALAKHLASTLQGQTTCALQTDGIHCEIRLQPSFLIRH